MRNRKATKAEEDVQVIVLGGIALALLEGAARGLAQRLVTQRDKPVNIHTLVLTIARDQAGHFQATPTDVEEALGALTTLVKDQSGLVIHNQTVTYDGTSGVSLGEALYGLDVEIAALRASKAQGSISPSRTESSPPPQDELNSVFAGVDEEIAAKRFPSHPPDQSSRDHPSDRSKKD